MRSMYASSGPKTEGVPTNNQRGRGFGHCRLWEGFDKALHIVPTALLVNVQRFRDDLYKAIKGPNTRPIVLSMIAGSYWRRRRRLLFSSLTRWNYFFPLSILSLYFKRCILTINQNKEWAFDRICKVQLSIVWGNTFLIYKSTFKRYRSYKCAFSFTLSILLCRLRSIAAHRDHFVRRLSVCVCACVRLSVR